MSVWQEAHRGIEKLALEAYDGKNIFQQLQTRLEEEEFITTLMLAAFVFE
jgi:hypothetical protein